VNEPAGSTLDEFIPFRLDEAAAGGRVALAQGSVLERRDLFNIDRENLARNVSRSSRAGTAIFVVSEALKVSVDTTAVPPAAVQCFLAALSAAFPTKARRARRPLLPFILDEEIALTVWTSDAASHGQASELWNAISEGGSNDEAETATTPKLYGSKLRLTQLLVGAACSVLPIGAPILDAMAGTGIVSRKLSARFDVSSNDANPYAALLTRTQGALLPENAEDLLGRLKGKCDANFRALVNLAPNEFARESDFLHGELTEERLTAYRNFCDRQIFPADSRPTKDQPYQLCVARYANFYFGLAQAAQLDSVRAAIDEVMPWAGDARDICLAAVIIAASICNSGPHFAQPRKLSSLRSFREMVERRARSVLWEFELAVRRLAARAPLRRPLRSVTQLDWPEAIKLFAQDIGPHRPAAVYFDPPYSKLQYSRYYHVLNTLISYDYPRIEGVGRYPPLSERFSSRFEYRARTAQREFESAFELCRTLGLHALVSYSDRGFVPIETLSALMQDEFKSVSVFSENIRHHSQGVRLGEHQGHVTEFVLVGRT
jgi:hypothetical protein